MGRSRGDAGCALIFFVFLLIAKAETPAFRPALSNFREAGALL
jgi:hypothetical protein